MTNELIPWVDSHFRTLADKDHRAMGGLSMGGGITASVTMVNLDKFSYIGLFSGGSAAGFGGRGRGGAAPGATPAAAPAPPAAPATLDLNMQRDSSQLACLSTRSRFETFCELLQNANILNTTPPPVLAAVQLDPG